MKKYLAFALFVLIMVPGSVRAADGDLDVTFGTGGRVASAENVNESAVALQSDGRIVVAGSTRSSIFPFSDQDFVVIRYNSDGSLDGTFGTGGKVTTDFPGRADLASALALQSDGKIVVAGRSSLHTGLFSIADDIALARYNSDGSLDGTFGTGGKVTTDFYNDLDVALGLALQSDGKIVVAGATRTSRLQDIALARYNSDGSLDGTFGTGGKVTTDFPGLGSWASAVALQSDGKIVAAGGTGSYTAYNGNFVLARYNSDGSVDTTFGAAGKVITDFYNPQGDDAAYALALQSNGKIVAAGGGSSTESGLRLARYNSDGSLDPTFGIGGKVTNGADARSLAIQSDGKVVIGTLLSLVRYNNDGSVDTTFGTGGNVSGDILATGVALQSDEKIVLAGYSPISAASDFALVRYNNGLPIMKFDPATVPLGSSFTTTFSRANLSDETYFDVRFRIPGSDTDQVALNWQRGLSAAHTVTTDTVTGIWGITGVRPHQNANDHSPDFLFVTTGLRVAP